MSELKNKAKTIEGKDSYCRGCYEDRDSECVKCFWNVQKWVPFEVAEAEINKLRQLIEGLPIRYEILDGEIEFYALGNTRKWREWVKKKEEVFGEGKEAS